MSILIDAVKMFDIIQHPFMIKTQQRGYRGNVQQHDKCHV